MKNLKLLTKVNYWLILICFFLPFMVDTCIHDTLAPKNKSTKTETISKNDTVAANQTVIDTAKTAKNETIQKADTAKQKVSPAKRIYNFIVSPSKDAISGLGFIIYYSLAGLMFIIPVLCFLLVITSLIIVQRKKPKYLVTAIFSAISFILFTLLLFGSDSEISDFLIGFWLIYILLFISFVLNWMSYRLNRLEDTKIGKLED